MMRVVSRWNRWKKSPDFGIRYGESVGDASNSRMRVLLERVTLACDVETVCEKAEGSPYSITERRVLELIPVLGSQPAGDATHKPGGRLPLLSARPAITPVTLKRAATNFADR